MAVVVVVLCPQLVRLRGVVRHGDRDQTAVMAQLVIPVVQKLVEMVEAQQVELVEIIGVPLVGAAVVAAAVVVGLL